jgi:Fe-S-cluster containining protein
MSGADPGFFEGLQDLYADLATAIAAHAPVCQVSGRCCRFVEYDHTLFVSSLEVAWLLATGPAPVRPLDSGQTCPWQDAQGRCTARDARPLGCRLYYCDPSFETAMQELAESFIRRLKRLHAEYGQPWDYRPLHGHLQSARDAGRFPMARSESRLEAALDT